MAHMTVRAYSAAVWLLIAPATGGMAQPAGTAMAAVQGRVTDRSGAVLPGVTVVASSPALMGTQMLVTTDEGFYRFPTLPPGEHTIQFTLAAFGTATRVVNVSVGFTATVDVVLDVAIQETVPVRRRSPVLDRHATSIATSFDLNYLANAPTSRSVFAVLTGTPSVYVTRTENGGGFVGSPYSAYGTFGANRPMVEGISVAGIFPTGTPLDYGSFEEISVGTGALAADWPLPGVQMQLVSKSGGNQYHGTLYADYENRGWQAFNIDEEQITRGASGGPDLSPREANRVWSYHDVNADLGGFIRPDVLWWYSSFRNQELAARQPNFPVKPHRTRLTNYTAKGTYRASAANTFVVYGQAGRNHQPTRLDPFGLTSGSLNATTAINDSESSTSKHTALGWVWKGEWKSAIDENLFLEVRAGQFGSNRSDKPNGSGPRFENTETLVVSGGNRDWQRDLRRNQVYAVLTYFQDGWLGSHDVKAGGEILRVTEAESWRTSYAGDVLHVLNRGPDDVFLFRTPSLSESGMRSSAAYVSDSWRLNRRLTLNLGFHFDRYQAFLPAQQHPAFTPDAEFFPAVDNLGDWNTWVPRVGAAYDLMGNGKTLLKGTYGRYYFPPGTELGFNANPNANPWWQRYPWVDRNGDGDWDPGEEDRSQPGDSRGGVALESLDPSLELSSLSEITAWVERELAAVVALRTGFVWRGERDHFGRQNVSQPFDDFITPVLLRDPGPDGQRDNADDGGLIQTYDLHAGDRARENIVRNVPNSDSDHWTWEITAARRFSGRWSVLAGFSHTWSHDQVSPFLTQPVRQNVYPLTPNDFINTGESGRYEFRTWTAKIHGTYAGPWDLRVTPLLRHQSGHPFGRTFNASLNNSGNIRVLAEPIGSRRLDHVTILDVRLEKGFRFSVSRRVAAFLDVFNLLNANPVQNANWGSGSGFLQPLNILAPRIARIGARLEW
jgi:Carboxypeptidase regulatory-like domain